MKNKMLFGTLLLAVLALILPGLSATQSAHGSSLKSGLYNNRIQNEDEQVFFGSQLASKAEVRRFAGFRADDPQVQATWATQANQLGGRSGQRFTLVCPGGGTLSGRLWGTDLYTDDSSICTAAVHAGLISVRNGGTVMIELRPGAGAYNASSRYGVTSQGYGAWSGSFIFIEGKEGGRSGGDPQVQATWATQANQLGGRSGQRFTLVCPGEGTLSGRLWGTDLYTDDSSICTAAVHAGLINTARGGTVTIELRPGAGAYNASSRYGVNSQGYGAWSGSFVFVGGGQTGGGRGICDDLRTQALMDEWLANANPPENRQRGWQVRYDSWGRLVGQSPSAIITGLPQGVDTRLTRCEYLWSIAVTLRSTNLGTLREYVEQRRR